MAERSLSGAPLDLTRPTRAKIVATLGPACDSPEMVRRLVEAGVAAFRLNFSHGTLEDHQKRLRAVRGVAKQMRRPIAVFGDLCGPKIRVGIVPGAAGGAAGGTAGGSIELKSGEEVAFRRGIKECVLEPARARSRRGRCSRPRTRNSLMKSIPGIAY
jgi:pyruvate kinase